MRLLLSLLVSVLLTVPCYGDIAAISSVSVTPNGPPYTLQSITIGGYTINDNELRTGTVTALPGGTDTGGNFFNTWQPPFDTPAPASNFDINDILARNANPNPIRVTAFGGGDWSNINGANPDFFIFEAAAGGNVDGDVTVQAILPGDILGVAVALAPGLWGDTDLNRVGNPNGGHDLKGVSFSVTDLLDDSGVALGETASLLGLQINSAGLDPSFVGAAVPEPSSLTLICLASLTGLFFAIRRRR